MISLVIFAVILVGFGFYYFRIYSKGKAAGGGLMEGFAQQARDRWGATLQPGEDIAVWGTGFLRRPAWQYFLANNVPVLRLVWPMTTYEFAITNQQRLCIGTSGSFGGLSDVKASPMTDVRVASFAQEEQGLAMKLNPLVPKDHATYSLDLNLPHGGPLPLMGVSKDLANALPKSA